MKFKKLQGVLKHVGSGCHGTYVGVNKLGSLFQYNKSASRWDQMCNGAIDADIGHDGSLWKVTEENELFRWVKEEKKWEKESSFNVRLVSVAQHNKVAILTQAGKICVYEAEKKTFFPLQGGTRWRSLSICTDGTIWATDVDEKIWRHSLGQWEDYPGHGQACQAQGVNHDTVFVRASGGSLFQLNGNTWDQKVDNVSWFGAGCDGTIIYADMEGKLFTHKGEVEIIREEKAFDEALLNQKLEHTSSQSGGHFVGGVKQQFGSKDYNHDNLSAQQTCKNEHSVTKGRFIYSKHIKTGHVVENCIDDLNEESVVHFHAPTRKPGSILFDDPVGIGEWYQVEVVNPGNESAISVGLGASNHKSWEAAGFPTNSLGFHFDDNKFYAGRGESPSEVRATIKEGDLIKVGVIPEEKWADPNVLVWTPLNGHGEALGCGDIGSLVCSNHNRVFIWDNFEWKQLPGNAKQCDVGPGGHEMWASDQNDEIYRILPGKTNWVKMEGLCTQIAVGGYGRCATVNERLKVYKLVKHIPDLCGECQGYPLVCHHLNYKGYCGSCTPDWVHCVYLGPHQHVGCHHHKFEKCCDTCKIDKTHVKVVSQELKRTVEPVILEEKDTLVCHHHDFVRYCGKCTDDGENCLVVPAFHAVTCHHKDFKGFCGECRVDGLNCKIVREKCVCHHFQYADHCGECTPDKVNCVYLGRNQHVGCRHLGYRAVCKECRVDNVNCKVWCDHGEQTVWQKLEREFVTIGMGADGELWATDEEEEIWRYNEDIVNWDKVNGQRAKRITVANADNVYILDQDNEIRWWNPASQDWKVLRQSVNIGRIEYIASGVDGTLFVRNSETQLFLHDARPHCSMVITVNDEELYRHPMNKGLKNPRYAVVGASLGAELKFYSPRKLEEFEEMMPLVIQDRKVMQQKKEEEAELSSSRKRRIKKSAARRRAYALKKQREKEAAARARLLKLRQEEAEKAAIKAEKRRAARAAALRAKLEEEERKEKEREERRERKDSDANDEEDTRFQWQKLGMSVLPNPVKLLDNLTLNMYQFRDREKKTWLEYELVNQKDLKVELTLDFTGTTNFDLHGDIKQATRADAFQTVNAGSICQIDVYAASTFGLNYKCTTLPPDVKKLKQSQLAAEAAVRGDMEDAPEVKDDANIHELIETLEKSGTLFVDKQFPPVDESIWPKKHPREVMPFLRGTGADTFQWRRPSDYLRDDWELFQNIDPLDVGQGSLGNCWFCCALSAIAEFPRLVQRVFEQTHRNGPGLYELNFCRNGRWTKVRVDDYIACFPNSGPIFSKTRTDEVWVQIAEKAYAKMYGDYNQLRSGFPSDAFTDLTGFPSERFNFKDPKTAADIKSGKFYSMLKQYDEFGYLLAGGTFGVDTMTESGMRTDDNGRNPAGIVPGHAYSILEVREACGAQLLRLRNPWGSFEWKGDWSDSSPLWTPETKAAFLPKLRENDGEFWMCFDDFLKFFGSVNVCYCNSRRGRKWYDVRLPEHISFNSATAEALSDNIYEFKVSGACDVMIGVHQQDKREKNSVPGIDIGVVLMRGDDFVGYAPYSSSRTTHFSATLQRGNYSVIPISSGAQCRMQDIKQRDITLVMHADVREVVESLISKPHHHGVYMNAMHQMCAEALSTTNNGAYSIYDGFLGSIYVLGVEVSPSCPRRGIDLTFDMSDSENVASNRGDLKQQAGITKGNFYLYHCLCAEDPKKGMNCSYSMSGKYLR